MTITVHLHTNRCNRCGSLEKFSNAYRVKDINAAALMGMTPATTINVGEEIQIVRLKERNIPCCIACVDAAQAQSESEYRDAFRKKCDAVYQVPSAPRTPARPRETTLDDLI